MKLITRSEAKLRRPRNRSVRTLTGKSTGHWNGPTITAGGQTTWDHSKCVSLVQGIQKFHMDIRGWSDIAYNFIVCPHGYVFEGRGLNVINAGNGTNAGNRSSHAVVCLAGEGNPFSSEEKLGFRECVKYISDNTPAPNQAIGHRDHKVTVCPGPARYNWIRSGMPVDTAPQGSGMPPFNPDRGQFSLYPIAKNKALVRRGARGDVVAYLQGVIKHKAGGAISVDGDFGSKTENRVKDVQRFFKLTVDGVVGSKTWDVIDFLARR